LIKLGLRWCDTWWIKSTYHQRRASSDGSNMHAACLTFHSWTWTSNYRKVNICEPWTQVGGDKNNLINRVRTSVLIWKFHVSPLNWLDCSCCPRKSDMLLYRLECDIRLASSVLLPPTRSSTNMDSILWRTTYSASTTSINIGICNRTVSCLGPVTSWHRRFDFFFFYSTATWNKCLYTINVRSHSHCLIIIITSCAKLCMINKCLYMLAYSKS
jgi:hypothetical protein